MMADSKDFSTPVFMIYEDRLRRNLELISDVARRAGVNIIMAFKANAVWKTFPIIKEYCKGSTASSLNEMKLGREFLGNDVHTYCPAYTDETIEEYLDGSTHITFNSISQFERFKDRVEEYNRQHPESRVSPGLRVNPHCSVIETDLYNPALP
ncbi:MAG: carboxynorspermidine decarboxylase, partial [Muribaculaceae bacterium]|nr:carboxynorspermidine decarboxylase [Muribaculaceae bacterium]